MPRFADEVVSQEILDFLRGAGLPATVEGQQASTTQFGIVIYANNGASIAFRAVQANDSRLSNARTPTTHSNSHKPGGGDEIKLDDLAAPDDNTDLDATAAKHGLMPKADKVKLDGLPSSIPNGNVHISANVPLNTVGVDGDIALVLADRSTYYKAAGAWNFFGKDAKDVTNSQVTFVTPTAGDGSADISTP
jgi:hypothetical protein